MKVYTVLVAIDYIRPLPAADRYTIVVEIHRLGLKLITGATPAPNVPT